MVTAYADLEGVIGMISLVSQNVYIIICIYQVYAYVLRVGLEVARSTDSARI